MSDNISNRHNTVGISSPSHLKKETNLVSKILDPAGFQVFAVVQMGIPFFWDMMLH
jgi:hypothetical protein